MSSPGEYALDAPGATPFQPITLAEVFARLERDRFARAFALWLQGYRRDPSGYRDPQALTNSPEDYGRACAAYFLDLLDAVDRKAPTAAPTGD